MPHLLTFTYQDYLENWEDHFGDADSADYPYLSYGEYVPYTVKKLSEQEFNAHLKNCNDCLIAFDVALKANDDPGMGAALASSFPSELALLI